jgi:signal recognition particle subunit SRP68
LADARKKQATTLTEVTWRGKVVPLKSEKLRVAFLSAQDTTYELEREENLETKLDLYDKLFICYNDALRIILEEIRADPSSASAPAQRSTKTEVHLQNLQVLQSYLTFLKLSRTVERNLQLVDSVTKRLKGQGVVAGEETSITQKVSRPDELVRLFENLIQNMNDLEEVRPKDDVEQGKEIAANILTFKAFRCFYLGISYGDGNKVDEAIALFDRAAKHTAAAVDHHKACASPKRVSTVFHLQSVVSSVFFFVYLFLFPFSFSTCSLI